MCAIVTLSLKATYLLTYLLIDTVLSSTAHYSRPTISNLPQFISMYIKSKKKTIAINAKLLAYAFTKHCDNLTNNDRGILTDISNST